MENKKILEVLQMMLDKKGEVGIDNLDDSRVAQGYAECLKDVAKLMGENPDNYGVK